MRTETVLVATQLSKHYTIAQGVFRPAATLHAVNALSFCLQRGQTLGVVGESGCGKSTLAQLVSMISPPSSGSLTIAGVEVAAADTAVLQSLRHRVQIVFQNPYGSLNPRQTIGAALMQPLRMNTPQSKAECRAHALDMLEQVGLHAEHFARYPHEFSGGQRQRIAIARALMLHPDILVLDEPVSALDVSIQAQILNLLLELQARLDLAYLFISHDLSVVRHIAAQVMVMYLGGAVEHSTSEELFARPQHPYTRALLAATPVPAVGGQKQRVHLRGEIPSPIDPPRGCVFHPRCPWQFARCTQTPPRLKQYPASRVACHAIERDAVES